MSSPEAASTVASAPVPLPALDADHLRFERDLHNDTLFMTGCITGFALVRPAMIVAIAHGAGVTGTSIYRDVFVPTASTWIAVAAMLIAAIMVFRFGLPRIARRLCRPLPERRRLPGKIFLAGGVVLLFAPTLLLDWTYAGFVVALLGTATGAGLVLKGLRFRPAQGVYCARCAYAYSHDLAHCPECGNPWHEPWKARLGRPGVNGRLCLMGAASLALAAVAMVVSSRG